MRRSLSLVSNDSRFLDAPPRSRRSGARLRYLVCIACLFGGLALPSVALGSFAPSGRGLEPTTSVSDARPALAATSWELREPLGWSSRPTTMKVIAIDDDGLDGPSAHYRISADAGRTWTVWEPVSIYTSPVSTTVHMTAITDLFVDSLTANRAQFMIRDLLGNTEVSPIFMLQVDGTAPGSPVGLTATPSVWTPTNLFTLTWTNPVDVSGVAKAYYKFGNAPASVSDYDGSRAEAGVSRIEGLASPAAGAVPCYVWLEDAAGNADVTRAVSVTLLFSGGVAPSRPFLLQVTPSSWTNVCVYEATWSNPPAPSGIAAAWYKWGSAPGHAEDGTRVAGNNIQSIAGLAPPYESMWDLHVWLEDGAGMKDHNNRRTVQAYCDTTPPTTSHVLVPAVPPSGWHTGPVVVNLSATDNLSFVAQTLWRRGGEPWNVGNSFSVSDLGQHVYYYRSVDNAGNEEVEREVTVRIDTQPPLSSHTASPPQPASGWYSDTVTLTISATDDHSGWDGTIWYRLNGGAWQQATNPAGVPVALSDPGVWEVSYYSRDRAGNAETPRVAGPYRIDRGRPTVTAAVSDPGEYVRPPVTISLSASDDEPGLITSGIERIEYRQVSGPGSGSAPWTRGDRVVIDGSLGDGAYVYEYRARDVAGNLSEVGRVTVRVDGTPPTQPTNLVATPTAWTKTNGQFGLCWANPSDFSGIAGIHYQINVDPAVTLIEGHPYVPLAGAQCLSNIAVVGDGQHTIYVWLQDRAGNHSRFQRAALQNAFKLDTLSPIHDPPAIQGSLGCDGKHYTGPVTLTFRARDTLSGVASFRYRVNAGAWSSVPAASPNVVLTAQGRHIVEYHASDVAGNEQPVAGSITIYVDSEPPAEPIRLGVTPVTWTASNSFSATWGNPTDYAGVKAAYYKIGAPPASAKDGLRIEGVGITRIDGITAPREGEATLYLWLEDAACNVDHTTARTAVLRYDPTPPVTQIVVEGTLGEGGYYVSPLKVRFQATDASSGVRQTYYRFNSDQAWRAWDGTDIIIGGEGSHRVSYYSEDNAANKEWPRQTDPYRIDLRPPSCDISVASGYVQSSSVVVRWSGRDTMSGVARYTVEYSQAKNGPWQTWLADTNETSGTFSNLQQNRQTFFRVRARDGAGHLSAWSSERMDCNDDVYREGLGNPSFDLCDFGAWKPEGALGMQVLYAPARESGSSCMARLSQEREYYKVPKDAYASISQLIEIPRLEGGRQLELSFWYRLLSYDMAWGLDVEDGQEKWFDPFFVYIRGSGGQELARYLPEGNLMDPSKWEEFRLWDPGWLPYRVDLTPWIGQTVSIEFRVWNLVDQQWATWVFVDDVRLQPAGPRCGSYVPLIVKGTGASGLLLSEEISPVPPTPQVVPEPLAEGRPQWAPGLPEPKSRK